MTIYAVFLFFFFINFILLYIVSQVCLLSPCILWLSFVFLVWSPETLILKCSDSVQVDQKSTALFALADFCFFGVILWILAFDCSHCVVVLPVSDLWLFLFQYDDGLHGGYMEGGPGGMYEPHRSAAMPLGAHHVPHVPHPAAAMHYAPSNHVSPVPNHVMAAEPHVHKRDKDAIYGWVGDG